MWCCFFVFNISRLFFGLKHHLFDGPLAIKTLRAMSQERAGGSDSGEGKGSVSLITREDAAAETKKTFDDASVKVTAAFDAAATELGAAFAEAEKSSDNSDDEGEGKGPLRRALRDV